MKVRHILTAVLLCIATIGAMAHDNQNKQKARFNPEQFHRELVDFISKRAELTQDEAQRFFKLYDEMKDKQRKLQKEINRLKYRNCKNLTDKEAQQRIMKILDLEEDMADIKEDYYKKMLKALPAAKFHRAILAEDAFHRQMLRKFQSQQKRGATRK